MRHTPRAITFAVLLLAGAAAQAQTAATAGAALGASAAAQRKAPPAGMHGRYGSRYTPGWSMMSSQERAEHRKRMADAKTAQECQSVMAEHRKQMEERAAQRGRGPMMQPRSDACRGMPAG